jgi:transposase-like protein
LEFFAAIILGRTLRGWVSGQFLSEEAATKLLWLVLQRTQKNWTMDKGEWSSAKSQFAIMFGERFIKVAA